MLDLRLPVGLFFLIVGAILLVDGLVHPIITPGVHLVLNRDWGVCLLVFAALMTFFGVRGQRQINAEEIASSGPP
jgi:hypothetical protein